MNLFHLTLSHDGTPYEMMTVSRVRFNGSLVSWVLLDGSEGYCLLAADETASLRRLGE